MKVVHMSQNNLGGGGLNYLWLITLKPILCYLIV